MIRKLLAFFKLIRFPNLLIIALVQYLIRYCLLIPMLTDFFRPRVIEYLSKTLGTSFPLIRQERIDYILEENFVKSVLMSEFNFFLLSLSTVMIAAAGYIINDYFDVRTDVINKPNRLIIGVHIKRRFAMGAHLVISFIAILLGFYLGWRVGNWQLGTIHAFAFIFLWFYSTNYKKRFLIGNIIVAFLSALVILIVGIFERGLYTAFITDHSGHETVKSIMTILLTYGVFAFIISLAREIIKDIEDMEGDVDINSKTMPIVIGTKNSKLALCSIILTFIALLAYIQFLQLGLFSWIQLLYILIALQLPAVILLFLLYKADKKKDFHQLSLFIKGIMFAGILSFIVFF